MGAFKVVTWSGLMVDGGGGDVSCRDGVQIRFPPLVLLWVRLKEFVGFGGPEALGSQHLVY